MVWTCELNSAPRSSGVTAERVKCHDALDEPNSHDGSYCEPREMFLISLVLSSRLSHELLVSQYSDSIAVALQPCEPQPAASVLNGVENGVRKPKGHNFI